MGFEVTERCLLFDLFVLDFRVLTASKIDSGLLDDWDDRAECRYPAITQDQDDDPALNRAWIKNATSENHHHLRSVAAVVTTSTVPQSRSSRTSAPSVGTFSHAYDNGWLEDGDDSAEYKAMRLSPNKAGVRVSNWVSDWHLSATTP